MIIFFWFNIPCPETNSGELPLFVGWQAKEDGKPERDGLFRGMCDFTLKASPFVLYKDRWGRRVHVCAFLENPKDPWDDLYIYLDEWLISMVFM